MTSLANWRKRPAVSEQPAYAHCTPAAPAGGAAALRHGIQRSGSAAEKRLCAQNADEMAGLAC